MILVQEKNLQSGQIIFPNIGCNPTLNQLVRYTLTVMFVFIEQNDVLMRGKYKQTLKARSLLCYWGTRELGMTTVELAKKLKLAQPIISQSAMQGGKIALEEGLKLLEQLIQ